MTPKRVTQRRTKLEKHFTDVFSDLMAGKSQTEIAAKYGTTQAAVSLFKTRNAEVLNQALAESAYAVRALDISDKTFRISEYSDLYSKAKAEVDAAEASSDRVSAIREARGSLRAVAEELGALPRPDQNINIKALIAVRQVEGINLEDLG